MADSQLITPPFAKKRIEYLDALRGFTMLLVVMTHVSGLVFGVYGKGNYHQYFLQFRMPLFFFVSGFVFYKDSIVWNLGNIISFLRKKVIVQLVSPFLFLLCYIHLVDKALIAALTDQYKSGYWFTFTLFSYFILYILLQKVFDVLRLNKTYRFIALAAIGFLLFNQLHYTNLLKLGVSYDVQSFLGITQMEHFIFFVAGACVKKYFAQFERLIDKTLFVPIVVALYFLINIFSDLISFNNFYLNNNIKLLLGLCGIIIVFSWFRKNKSIFEGDGKISNILKFIGKRTLDIYLLHYFFIPYDLYKVFPLFADNSFPVIEFAATFIVTIFVVAACLVVSSVLRINNTLAHYLFGAKK